jgi:hypothetical protein
VLLDRIVIREGRAIKNRPLNGAEYYAEVALLRSTGGEAQEGERFVVEGT